MPLRQPIGKCPPGRCGHAAPRLLATPGKQAGTAPGLLGASLRQRSGRDDQTTAVSGIWPCIYSRFPGVQCGPISEPACCTRSYARHRGFRRGTLPQPNKECIAPVNAFGESKEGQAAALPPASLNGRPV
ncbi:hypothetical protein SKAU_G00387900 [Synaphobranchus kaupii]|uniref:Uncharacterized protein n=1 Tax=Synaphobranchus kaupii TaxID=118154 RepID=A0A9Q1EAU3_SYNKA|nr:hypothetical protein SKAU_G00387900 [Synaphobranchus kaupii]